MKKVFKIKQNKDNKITLNDIFTLVNKKIKVKFTEKLLGLWQKIKKMNTNSVILIVIQILIILLLFVLTLIIQKSLFNDNSSFIFACFYCVCFFLIKTLSIAFPFVIFLIDCICSYLFFTIFIILQLIYISVFKYSEVIQFNIIYFINLILFITLSLMFNRNIRLSFPVILIVFLSFINVYLCYLCNFDTIILLYFINLIINCLNNLLIYSTRRVFLGNIDLILNIFIIMNLYLSKYSFIIKKN